MFQDCYRHGSCTQSCTCSYTYFMLLWYICTSQYCLHCATYTSRITHASIFPCYSYTVELFMRLPAHILPYMASIIQYKDIISGRHYCRRIHAMFIIYNCLYSIMHFTWCSHAGADQFSHFTHIQDTAGCYIYSYTVYECTIGTILWKELPVNLRAQNQSGSHEVPHLFSCNYLHLIQFPIQNVT